MGDVSNIDTSEGTPQQSILEQVDIITSIEDQTQREKESERFISSRLEVLVAGSTPKEISIMSKTHKGFIHPDSEVKQALFLNGIKINDQFIYKLLLEKFREFKTSPSFAGKPIEALTTWAVQWAIGDYFGNAIGYSGQEEANERFFGTDIDIYHPGFNLSDIKGKSVALCTQKAAVAQNLLTFLGVDSTLILSQETTIDAERPGMHAYNLIRSKTGKDYIYDPTNPIWITNEDRNIVSLAPALYVVTQDQVKTVLSGGSVDVEHKNFDIKNNQTDSFRRSYGGPHTIGTLV